LASYFQLPPRDIRRKVTSGGAREKPERMREREGIVGKEGLKRDIVRSFPWL